MNNNYRNIPTEETWFNYIDNKNASWLYCYLISIATYHNGYIYISKENYYDSLPIIRNLLGVSDKQNRSIKKSISYLLDKGYIQESADAYIFVKKQPYISIDKDLLYELCTTRSNICAQIFIYLKNRLKYKKEKYNSDSYNFTIKEIKGVLGYSVDSQNKTIEKAIKSCLESLERENYIKYINKNVEVPGHNYKIPNYILTFATDRVPGKEKN